MVDLVSMYIEHVHTSPSLAKLLKDIMRNDWDCQNEAEAEAEAEAGGRAGRAAVAAAQHAKVSKTMLALYLCLCVCLFHSIAPASAFSPGASISTCNARTSTQTQTRLFASNKKSKINRDKGKEKGTNESEDDNISISMDSIEIAPRPTNEFSRTYRVESILSGGYRQRDYNVDVQATDEELKQLATRFELRNIYSLQAQLALRRERATSKGVEVDGEVSARLEQVCVRTGEVFDVDVQFPLFAIVRPILALGDANANANQEEDVPQELLDYQRTTKNKKRERVKTPNLKDMDVMELQNLLQDFDVEEDVMEDEAIYAINGKLDVGELVSQLFWLKLDPYPKKPGSDPVQSSISG